MCFGVYKCATPYLIEFLSYNVKKGSTYDFLGPLSIEARNILAFLLRIDLQWTVDSAKDIYESCGGCTTLINELYTNSEECF